MTKEDVLIEHIANWLANYLYSSGKKTFIVNYNGTRSDALLLKLCSDATAIKRGLGTICLYENFAPRTFLGRSYKIDSSDILAHHAWAHDRDGVILSPINKTFGKYSRTYSKVEYSLSDIFPLYDLYYSDILCLTKYLWPDLEFKDSDVDDYKMLEFCIKAENTFSIITSDDPPHKHIKWPTFTSDQKKFIASTQQREKKTRHKEVKRPYPRIPDKIGLHGR